MMTSQAPSLLLLLRLRLLLLLLFIGAGGITLCAAADSTTGQSTTVSVYLPDYDESDWAALRGSIVSSDKSVTAYTVFCADQAPSCQIAGEIPFVFTEGAHTLVYKGTDPGTLTADLQCKLDGTTAATCTASSSLGSDHREGTLTGPTQTEWTRTFTGADVTWGVLTLATPGPLPAATDIDGNAIPTVTPTSTPPVPTSSGAVRRVLPGTEGLLVVMTLLGGVGLDFLWG